MLIWYKGKTKDPKLQPQEIKGTMEIPEFEDRVAEYNHVNMAVRDKYDWRYYLTAYGPAAGVQP